MSPVLGNPFQEPFEFPRPGPLLTPPDTDSEYQGHSHVRPLPAPMGLGIDLDPAPTHRSASLTEVPISRKLQYIHSGPREARERVVQRSVRWLVVVTPPLSFTQEHGHFGHTLSSGSPQRLSQGVLLPLFPTMSSQLSAIAREFAFPSTAGLCIYLHTSHGGFSITPRITDEAWPLLWAHLFEPRSPTGSTSQLPIGGRIEFDIDIGKARWYDSWLGLARRDVVDVPMSVTPSRRGSVTHVRDDSRTSFDEQADDQQDSAFIPLARISRAAGNKHVPRKLSLLDRLESSSARSGSKLVPRAYSPPSPIVHAASRRVHGLSPVVQEDEPNTARNDIDNFVNSWRATSAVTPSPLAATGQTSLDPVNIPNHMHIVDPSSHSADVHSELDLNDFQWSVSSAGPGDYEFDENDFDTQSLESWRIPSVHLDRRAQGSVCLTPTTCTSFGPPDWDASPVLDADWLTQSLAALLPSPDIAARMIEDCPPTPSTATSWGPPLEYPPSPLRSELSYAPSVDIGQRCMSAVPLTPSTATSWGPPLSWPPSPATPYYVRTPDVGQRSFDVDAPVLQPAPRPPRQLVQEEDQQPWRNVWPYIGTAAPNAAPSGMTSPYTFVFPQRPSSPPAEPEARVISAASDVQTAEAQPSSLAQQPGPFSFGWPFFNAYTEAPVTTTQPPPEHDVQPHDEDADAVPTARVRKMSPFRFVFAPEQPRATSSAQTLEAVLPVNGSPWNHVHSDTETGPWNLVWPFATSDETERKDEVVTTLVNYPYFNIYPAVYPHFELYPKPACELHSRELLSVHLSPSYPTVQPYRSEYPFLEIYPPVIAEASIERDVQEKPAISVRLPCQYPTLDIYAPVYPWNVYDIFPSVQVSGGEQRSKSVTVQLTPSSYPILSIYEPVYPYNLEVIYPAVKVNEVKGDEVKGPVSEPMKIRLEASYPHFDLYPSVYPFNLANIYPPVSLDTAAQNKTIRLRISSVYPSLSIYSPVYPHNLEVIYPPVTVDDIRLSVTEPMSMRLQVVYPHFDLYPAVYPFNLESIYPSVFLDSVPQKKKIALRLPSVYPSLSIYSPVYPYNLSEIYPAVKVDEPLLRSASPIVVRLSGHYPNIEIYPAQYPWNLDNIYPIVTAEPTQCASVVVELPVQYPTVQPYQHVYPYNLENIYPRVTAILEQIRSTHAIPKLKLPPPSARSGLKPHREHGHGHGHHAKRSSSTSKDHVPPVPPLPQNIRALRPINPISHQPLAYVKAEIPQPLQRPTVYPYICPYPPVYPYFDLYPEATAENGQSRIAQLSVRLEPKYPAIEIYTPVYPFLEIYPQAAAGFALPPNIVITTTPAFAPRRKPKYSHLQLRAMVVGEPEKVEVTVRPVSPRRLPVPPQIRVPDMSLSTPPATPRASPNGSPSASPRNRSRSGTVSARPPLPTPPVFLGSPSPPTTSPQAESPTKPLRRLPAIPADGSQRTSPVHARSQIPRGLPSSPAASRRASMVPPLSRSSSTLSTLSAVPEPDAVSSDAYSPSRSPVSPSRRPLPPPPPSSVSPTSLETPALQRSESLSSRLPSPQPPADLARTRSLPSRPLPRVRRDSVAAAPATGVVAGLTKVYDAPPAEKSHDYTSTLAQFPTPPRAPLPNPPNSRRVSKLDISKYPFN